MAVFEVVKGDITKISVDVIVNAANSSLLGGGGVDGAIHREGGPEILEACKEIRRRQGGCPVGEAVITTAGKLPARFVIHAAGPVWHGGRQGERQLLAAAYQNSLSLASSKGLRMISFPNISTGVYHFPKKEAAEIAIATVRDYLSSNVIIEKVLFVCFDDENEKIYRAHLQDLN